MDTSDMIDLGREYDSPCCCAPEGSDKKGEKKISYPSIWASKVSDLPDFPDGDFYILAKVSACSVTKNLKEDDENSFELEVKGLKVVGAAPSKEEKDAYADMEDLAERGSAGRLADALEMETEEE